MHDLRAPLVSVGHICDQGKVVVFSATETIILGMPGIDVDERCV